MFAAFESGTAIEDLMAEYGLGETRVRAILADEKMRRLFSPHPYYRQLRLEMEHGSSNEQPALKSGYIIDQSRG